MDQKLLDIDEISARNWEKLRPYIKGSVVTIPAGVVIDLEGFPSPEALSKKGTSDGRSTEH